ncbi:DNA-directed RNA polymerase III subunit RPC6 [Phytophthora pseudosyringae]|uniref:DNA-directed RNA polymerase III subunit RPC6 n=1 Tax=Phytophthora pseudosyringae TaxID=221518 RepID=A0A8T1VLN4_9STRA|nr:DNA-directed RNA polymerase III subunit RPC6 [Phytophthora pseudosyringae]
MASASTPKGGAPSVATKFLGLLRNYREPVTDAEVRDYFQSQGGGGYEQLPDVINALLSEGKIKIFKKGSVLSYGIVDAEEAERIRGLTLEQRLVLQEIERAGNKGIWTRDIKSHTNIPQQIVTKTLRLLETRRLVKSVKSISSKNKKLYMLFDLVPSTEITGGPWYNEQEFDHVFIDTLSTFVYEVIKASGMSTLNAITDKVHASGISKVALGPEEIRSIIQTLMYDGRVEEVRSVRLTPGASHEIKYKVSQQITTFNYLSETPCGVCPVFDQCQEGNVISPRSCLYMTKWLGLKELDF